MNKFLFWSSIILGMCIAGFFLFSKEHVSVGYKDNSYTISLPFDRVKKILIHSNTVEEIVAYNGAKLLDKQINSINISSDKLLSGWEADMNGTVVVETNPKYAGKLVLRLKQHAHLTKTKLVSETTLWQPAGYLQNVESILTMTPDEDVTRVRASVKITYGRRVPTFLINFMDRKVQEVAEEVSFRNQGAINNLMNKNANKKFFIPINKKKN